MPLFTVHPPGLSSSVESADLNYAVAGGNVCAIAQKRGIVGFVIDGVIRDLAEIRGNRFPVFARGIMPIPGGKDVIEVLNGPIRCGGVDVRPGDKLVGDEEGIVVVPAASADAVHKSAQARAAKNDAETLESWEKAHHARIEEILSRKGFAG